MLRSSEVLKLWDFKILQQYCFEIWEAAASSAAAEAPVQLQCGEIYISLSHLHEISK